MGRATTTACPYLRLEALALIEVDHGSDQAEDPSAFRILLTLDEQSNGKTVVTLRLMHPTKARRDEMIGFGVVEYGAQTLDKLTRHAQRACVRAQRASGVRRATATTHGFADSSPGTPYFPQKPPAPALLAGQMVTGPAA